MIVKYGNVTCSLSLTPFPTVEPNSCRCPDSIQCQYRFVSLTRSITLPSALQQLTVGVLTAVHPLMISGYPGPQHAHLEAPYYVLSNGRFVQQQPVAFLPQVMSQQANVSNSNGYGNAMRDSANIGAGSHAYMFANQAPGPARNIAPGAPVYAGSPFDQTLSSPSRAINGYQGTQSARVPQQTSGLGSFNPSPSNISSTSIHHLNETSNPAGPIGPREKLSVDSDKLGIFGSGTWNKN
jgi:hypothetical protein